MPAITPRAMAPAALEHRHLSAIIAPVSVWYDTRARTVTIDRPTQGVQLVAVGAVIPPRMLASLSTTDRATIDGTPPPLLPGSPLTINAGAFDDEQPEPDAAGFTTVEPLPPLVHVGGGWYELPNGERIRGREEAEAALEALAVTR